MKETIEPGDLVVIHEKEPHPATFQKLGSLGTVIKVTKNTNSMYSNWATVLWDDGEIESISVGWLRKIYPLLVALTVLGCSSVPSVCSKKSHTYLVNMCMAERSADTRYCDRIEDKTMNVTCKAMTQKRERVCYEIDDVHSRDWCLMMVK